MCSYLELPGKRMLNCLRKFGRFEFCLTEKCDFLPWVNSSLSRVIKFNPVQINVDLLIGIANLQLGIACNPACPGYKRLHWNENSMLRHPLGLLEQNLSRPHSSLR